MRVVCVASAASQVAARQPDKGGGPSHSRALALQRIKDLYNAHFAMILSLVIFSYLLSMLRHFAFINLWHDLQHD